jgi:hypothetical protein
VYSDHLGFFWFLLVPSRPKTNCLVSDESACFPVHYCSTFILHFVYLGLALYNATVLPNFVRIWISACFYYFSQPDICAHAFFLFINRNRFDVNLHFNDNCQNCMKCCIFIYNKKIPKHLATWVEFSFRVSKIYKNNCDQVVQKCFANSYKNIISWFGRIKGKMRLILGF